MNFIDTLQFALLFIAFIGIALIIRVQKEHDKSISKIIEDSTKLYINTSKTQSHILNSLWALKNSKKEELEGKFKESLIRRKERTDINKNKSQQSHKKNDKK